MKTRLQEKLSSLTQSELDGVAKKLDTSSDYLKGHIYHSRKIPRREFMNELQSELSLSDDDMYQHFFKKPKAAEQTAA